VATIDTWRRFKPTASQERFLRSKAFGRLFSSGYGSGKSKTGCREAIAWAVNYPGSRGLIGRQVADELKTTTMVTFWKEMEIVGFKGGSQAQMDNGDCLYVHNKAERYIDFWNKSRIYYRHLDDPEALGSLELNWAFIDEGAEVNDMIYKTISSSRLRWHLPTCDQDERVRKLIDENAPDEEVAAVACDCPRGIWVCTNPGASGYLRHVVSGKVADWEWIAAKPGDNPYNGPDYYAKMERDRQINGDIWMRKFYNGDWSAFEGMRFPMFDEERHILSAEWRPTDAHEVILGVDFGHVETFVAWIAYHPSRNEPVVVFHELQVQEVQEPRQVADAVKRINADYGIKKFYSLGDPAGVGASQFSAVSPIAAYAGLGWYIDPCKAGKSPIDRANMLAAFLNENRRQPDGSIWPGIVFGPNCPAVVDSILSLRWKEQVSRSGEDPREKFVDKNKHGFDGLTYGLVGVPPPDTAPARPRKVLSGNMSAKAMLEALEA
jgi:hypothetical protein